ncbi:MAG: hypoxanthine-guanine phosphoribosyltransferase [Methylomonas sp.]|nr:hypoxanthine-guanine phosphoribosyltransferase [Methylomonas sp.]PPD21820.1 MAG: hypoxanthine-guanine phosphoribosyltransferase [Methylomonas sp.]PPD27504.1 MAG: hypoxanthine-guanine phosphoribosyltransferase [Methylomonas sp.]PPD39487.1 MAG: hypoxanthine-guanine phosphoribosyltransferase [Methylomonas sp.]PPD42287.1 MAG: hypoxanthine-guanine phosphoribosyltransferase [Methylomonas sp.]
MLDKINLEEIDQVAQTARLLYDQNQVNTALDRMACAINERLADANPLVLCVINGGIIVAGQLLPRLSFPLMLDSLHASRYRGSTTGQDIHWLFQPTTPLQDRNLLIVDDILDEGHTLKAIVDWCKAQGAASVYTAVLLDKMLEHAKPIAADFVGLPVENHYLFGYGMDYKNYLRNAAGIYACKETS